MYARIVKETETVYHNDITAVERNDECVKFITDKAIHPYFHEEIDEYRVDYQKFWENQ